MSYYPIYPIPSQYLYPPPSLHLHSEISAIRHGQLLREQAELQYLSNTQLQLARLEAAKHQSELFEREIRISNILNSNRAKLELERRILQERAISEELRMKQELLRLDRERALLFSNEQKSFLTDRKQRNSLYAYNNSQARSQAQADLNKETAKFRSAAQGGEILNFKPKEPASGSNEEKAAKIDNISHKKRVHSTTKDISYNYQDDTRDNFGQTFTKRRSSILKNSNKRSPSQPKSKRVQFLKEPPFKEGNSSYCLNNSALKAAMTPSRKDFHSSASKKIENRLKLSTVVYRDSQFRNIKHEIEHLFNTYETECRLRREVKGKINGRDEVIQKHNIVVEQK